MGTMIASLFFETCRRGPERPAMVFRTGQKPVMWTWEHCQRDVEALANWFLLQGFQPGDRIALICETRPEWLLADLAMQAVGLVGVPLYPTLSARQVAQLLEHSGARAVIVSHRRHLDKVLGVAGHLPGLAHLVVIDPVPVLEPPVPVTAWIDALAVGRRHDDTLRAQRLVRLGGTGAHSLCSIIYTSGTTGDPKGVMLSHANIVANVEAILKRCDLTPQDTSLSYLPLSHVLERITSYAVITAGATIGFASGADTLMNDLAAIRPTVMAAVPRVLDKIHDRILEGVRHRPFVERHLWRWAIDLAHRRLDGNGTRSPEFGLADRLVLGTVRNQFGGRMRLLVCGGAPLNVGIARFFLAAGVPVAEGYGLTETSPVVSMNYPGHIRSGTVGPLLPGVSVRLADDGEICVRGPNVMSGYFRDPEATAAAFDADGWFHTGDIGRFDPDGYLKITDRKKEVIVLSNGKNVAPLPIESALSASPFIQQILVFGDDRPSLAALIVPDFTQLNPWAYERGLPLDREALIAHEQVHCLVRDELERLGRELARFEQVRRFALLPRAWSVESGELTPTLKLRRKAILAGHAGSVRSLDPSGEPVNG